MQSAQCVLGGLHGCYICPNSKIEQSHHLVNQTIFTAFWGTPLGACPVWDRSLPQPGRASLTSPMFEKELLSWRSKAQPANELITTIPNPPA